MDGESINTEDEFNSVIEENDDFDEQNFIRMRMKNINNKTIGNINNISPIIKQKRILDRFKSQENNNYEMTNSKSNARYLDFIKNFEKSQSFRKHSDSINLQASNILKKVELEELQNKRLFKNVIH